MFDNIVVIIGSYIEDDDIDMIGKPIWQMLFQRCGPMCIDKNDIFLLLLNGPGLYTVYG